VWDEKLGRAVAFDSSKGETYALLGTYQVDGKTVKTSFQILKDYVKDFTPEWAQPITTIPAAKIREIARDLVSHAQIGKTIDIEGFEFPYRPSCIFMGRGMASHMLGVEAAKALGSVNLLLGNLDVPGGIQGTANANWYTLHPDKDGILEARRQMANQVTGEDIVFPPETVDMGSYYPMRHAAIPLAWKTINDPKKYHLEYPVNVMMIHGGDPIGSVVNGPEVAAALKKIPFVFSVALHYDLPTQFADILLAESALLEKDAMYRVFRNEKETTHHNRGLMGTLVRRPVVANVYNTKVPEDIFIELSARLGKLAAFNAACTNAPLFSRVSPTMAVGLKPEYALAPDRKYTWREFIDRKLASDYGEGVLPEFEKCAFKPFRLPLKETYNYYYVPENAVRLPVYYERMVRNGEKMMAQLKKFNTTVPNQDMDHIYSHYSGMAVWYDNAGYETTADYPFKAVNWKVHYGVNNTGALYENAYIQEIIDYSNPNVKCIWLPASAAAALGIGEGDMVCVESRFGGKTQGKVHLSEFMHPKCIGIPGNFGRRTRYMNPVKNAGVHFNSLLSVEESTINPISLSLESSPQVKIYKI
jgi:anaerobic selenocysteine-containing dehydrogenase